MQALDSAFAPLRAEEKAEDWGRELHFGIGFARDFDLYRAVTCFRRSLMLIPEQRLDRQLQAHYHIIQAYYLGSKYREVSDYFSSSPLVRASNAFPAYRDLLVMLYDSYQELCDDAQAERIMRRLESDFPETAHDMKLSWALRRGHIEEARCLAEGHRSESVVLNSLDAFACQKKSVSTAKTLNAVLPGAGYLYVGQKSSAVTSFALNALFIAAAYHFFDDGNWAAGVITLSLEGGWYFGGINGAGIAANEYNEWAYECVSANMLNREKLFPVLTLEFSF